MNLKTSIFLTSFDKIICFLFIIFLFSLPFVSYSFILNPIKVGQELYIVSIIALGLFFRILVFYRIKSLKIHIVDVLFFTVLSYYILHYYFYSYFGFLYNEFWIFLNYIVLFYLFKWSFGNKKNGAALFDFTVVLTWFIAIIQSIIGLLQQFDFLKSDNEFFKVTGTFINPNFLGIAMLLGLIATLYLYYFLFFEKKILKLFLVLSLPMIIYVLFLTQSRAAWIAFCVAIIVFFGTSEKSFLFFKTNKKKALGILFLIVFLGISSLYLLYKMDTDSVDGRRFIRKITYTKIIENPFLGNGVFNFKGIYNQSKAHYFLAKQRPWAEIKVGDYVGYAFNDYLQVVFEIGFLGLFLIGLLVFFILKDIAISPKTRFALSIIISFCFLGAFTSVLYNPNAMIYVIWALAIIVVFGKIKIPIIVFKNQFLIKGFAFFLIGFSCYTEFIFYKKINGLSKFKNVTVIPNQKIYYKLNDFDLLFIKEDPFIEFRYGYEKYQEGNVELGFGIMKNSVKKDPIPKANIALADLYYQQKKYYKTEELLKLNIGIEPSRFEPLNNLLQFYVKRKQYLKKVKIANEIIRLPMKKESAKVLTYKKIALSILKKRNLLIDKS